MRSLLGFPAVVGGGPYGPIGTGDRRTTPAGADRGAAESYTRKVTATPPAELSRLLRATDGPGQTAAWEGFLAQYSRLLLRVAFSFGPGYDQAMDRYAFILDALRKNDFRRLRRFTADGRGRFSTWLVAVARRLCLDHYRQCYGRWIGRTGSPGEGPRAVRRNLIHLNRGPEEITGIPDPAASSPEDELTAAERRSALDCALDGLSPTDRMLVTLRFEDGLSAREIADVVGLPTPFHVYRRLRTLCGKLRKTLRVTGVDPGPA
jgi:RNA polymerase sigma factor (sigma-70 family)